MSKAEYQELKAQAKLALECVKMPYKKHLVWAAYRVSKHMFEGKERLIEFFTLIINTAPVAKGWKE